MTMLNDAVADAFAVLQATLAAARWPGVEAGTSYRKPALNFRGKFIAGVKDADTFVVLCPIADKEFLLEAAPEIYFETDHYKGWPALLIRRSRIEPEELRHRIDRAWRMRAPKRLIATYDAGPGRADFD
jgi:hypothetical protein